MVTSRQERADERVAAAFLASWGLSTSRRAGSLQTSPPREGGEGKVK